MAIPAPPPDASGGFFIIKYTDGSHTHRQRVHVAPFNLDATGTYLAPAAGGDASVVATYNLMAANLQDFLRAAFTISLDAVFQVVANVATEYFGVTAPAAIAGGNAGVDVQDEVFICLNHRTVNGGHARFFIFHAPPWTAGPPIIYTATTGGTIYQAFAVDIDPAKTGVRGHDGSKLTMPGRATFGINKKLRRKQGNA
jgi:hypothetical protein